VYFELKELVNKYHGILENNDAELIYSGLFNYTKIKYLEGNEKYSAENAAIMKEMMTKRFYPRENNYMSENAFINYVSIALREKEYDWVENFIKDFKDQLSPEKKENICMYCLGILYYRKKEYNLALDHLAKVKTSDFFYHLRVNNHLLKIFYETGEMESVLTIIDSLRHSLANNKIIPDYVIERYSNYINNLQKLVKLHECKNAEKLDLLTKSISLIKEFENKAWILEMIKKELNPAG
jgi:hypothetical protein